MVTDAQLLGQGYLGDLTDEQKAKLESLARKGQYLLSLVREYLDLARVEGSELRIDPRSRVDISEDVVAEAVGHGEAAARRRAACASSRTTPHEPAGVLRRDAAAHRARQPARQRRQVRRRGRRDPRDRGGRRRPSRPAGASSASASGTRDRASPPPQRNKLFRRFSRLDDPALKTRRGTGVGLYNAWRIVQLHRGRITRRVQARRVGQVLFRDTGGSRLPAGRRATTGVQT